jgi:5'-nucleotidase
MKILVTNDDGIYAEGILSLVNSLKQIGEVIVVAPDRERSAVAHAITIKEPLRLNKVERDGSFFGYAATGTPADCVKIAIRSLLVEKPDIVISGINLGPNTGLSVLYSGTVSGAIEGAMLGVPAIAVSLNTYVDPDFTYASNLAKDLAQCMMDKGVTSGTCFNVNVPNAKEEDVKGVKFVRQGQAPFVESLDKRIDPRKKTYYWLTGEVLDLESSEGSDIDLLSKGFTTITPLQHDLTDYKLLDELQDWKF